MSFSHRFIKDFYYNVSCVRVMSYNFGAIYSAVCLCVNVIDWIKQLASVSYRYALFIIMMSIIFANNRLKCLQQLVVIVFWMRPDSCKVICQKALKHLA